jgi:hypothetical protein
MYDLSYTVSLPQARHTTSGGSLRKAGGESGTVVDRYGDERREPPMQGLLDWDS